jgi:hypothetical protein
VAEAAAEEQAADETAEAEATLAAITAAELTNAAYDDNGGAAPLPPAPPAPPAPLLAAAPPAPAPAQLTRAARKRALTATAPTTATATAAPPKKSRRRHSTADAATSSAVAAADAAAAIAAVPVAAAVSTAEATGDAVTDAADATAAVVAAAASSPRPTRRQGGPSEFSARKARRPTPMSSPPAEPTYDEERRVMAKALTEAAREHPGGASLALYTRAAELYNEKALIILSDPQRAPPPTSRFRPKTNASLIKAAAERATRRQIRVSQELELSAPGGAALLPDDGGAAEIDASLDATIASLVIVAPPSEAPSGTAPAALEEAAAPGAKRKAAAVARQKKFANKSVTFTLDGLTAQLGHKVLEKIARSGELAGGKKVTVKTANGWRDKDVIVTELRSLWPSGVPKITVTPPQKV